MIDAELGEQRIAALLVVGSHCHQRQEKNRHGREHGPALARVTDHAAECVSQRGGNQDEAQHLEEIRQRSGILVRVSGVGIQEAAAVGSEFLDRFLGSHRSHGQRLRSGAEVFHHRIAGRILDGRACGIHLGLAVRDGLDSRDVLVSAEILYDSLRHEHQGKHGRKWQQDI